MDVIGVMADTFGGAGAEAIEPQDQEILRALAAGGSPGAVAAEWGVSRWLVYKRIQRVRARLGVATTTQAVLAAAWLRAEGQL